MTNNIVLYGIGPLARTLFHHLTIDSDINVVAFTADKEHITEERFCDLPVTPFETVTSLYPPKDYGMLCAIGAKRLRDRQTMFEKAKDKGYALVNYISRKLHCVDGGATLTLGENNIIMPYVFMDPMVKMGDNNLFWGTSVIGHNSTIGDHNYFSGSALIAGNVKVGDLCFLGNSATVINGISLADETQVIAGAVMLKDSEPCAKYIGNPVRRIGFHHETGILIG